MMIEDVHHRAVCDEWDDAVCFVLRELERSDPDEHDDQAEPEQTHADTIKP
jgi:hypothetical protein